MSWVGMIGLLLWVVIATVIAREGVEGIFNTSTVSKRLLTLLYLVSLPFVFKAYISGAEEFARILHELLKDHGIHI